MDRAIPASVGGALVTVPISNGESDDPTVVRLEFDRPVDDGGLDILGYWPSLLLSRITHEIYSISHVDFVSACLQLPYICSPHGAPLTPHVVGMACRCWSSCWKPTQQSSGTILILSQLLTKLVQ